MNPAGTSGPFPGWIRVPVGEGSAPYLSVPFVRKVLIVARTVTTTEWLLDFLSEIFPDPRVQLVFTVEDEAPSVYHQGALDLLRDVGVPIMPWAQAMATRFDLAICSTHTGNLEHLRSPLMILPHGPGFGKPASVRPGGTVPLPVFADTDQRRGDVPATTVVISHPDQASLFAGHPPDVSLLMAGDPAYDRLEASLPFRDHYRASLGIGSEQKLIVLSSTWGPSAQLGRYPGLAVRLLSELPLDEYRVAMIIHPNIWYGHGPWQVRTWLRRAIDAGAILSPPRGDSWRGVAIAADLFVADHGSVAFYAASIGRPVLLCSFEHDKLVESSPLAELGRIAPALDVAALLRPQIDKAIREFEPGRHQSVVGRMTGAPGESLRIMREAIYRIIDLEEPPEPPRVLTVGRPDVALAAVTAQLALAAFPLSDERDGAVEVSLQRFPAVLAPPPPPESRETLRFLIVDERERDPRFLQSAAVVVRSSDASIDPTGSSEASWAARALERSPGCRIAASVNGPLRLVTLFPRGRAPLALRVVEGVGGEWSNHDTTLLVAAFYACDVTGRASLPVERGLTVRVGDSRLSGVVALAG